jgi:RIO-like serine/threonine protein kinase
LVIKGEFISFSGFRSLISDSWRVHLIDFPQIFKNEPSVILKRRVEGLAIFIKNGKGGVI